MTVVWIAAGMAVGWLVGNAVGIVVYVSLVERGHLVADSGPAAVISGAIVLAAMAIGGLAGYAFAR